jgi:hypothetical protein
VSNAKPTVRVAAVKRIVWLGIGAAGGVIVYRKGGQWLEQARDQGALVTVQNVVATSRDLLGTAQRALAGRPDTPGAAARAVGQSR